MSAPILTAKDQRWNCRDIVEIVSGSFDPDMIGIGSSPALGGMGQTGVGVPGTATADQLHRYLIRLCGFQVPSGKAAVIRGLRQLATLRQVATIESADLIRPVELEITSPLWSFTDGNISWHVKRQPTNMFGSKFDASQTPGTSPDQSGFESALLYVPPLAPYVPPGAGVPPGFDVSHLGTWRDMRFPWSETAWNLEVLVRGPCNVLFYCSVHQSDPETRPVLAIADPSALRPEDRFLMSFEDAVFGRVAGAMTIETLL
jgi:hypothetical protein